MSENDTEIQTRKKAHEQVTITLPRWALNTVIGVTMDDGDLRDILDGDY